MSVCACVCVCAWVCVCVCEWVEMTMAYEICSDYFILVRNSSEWVDMTKINLLLIYG